MTFVSEAKRVRNAPHHSCELSRWSHTTPLPSTLATHLQYGEHHADLPYTIIVRFIKNVCEML